MKNEYLNLSKIIDLKKWQTLQDSLALVTKMAIITIDYKGTPVSSHSQCHSFCKSVREDLGLSKYCQKCDSRGGLEAVRLNAPYIYMCHFNIVDVAIPIIVDDKYIGAIMAGQIKLPKSEETDILEQILNTNNSLAQKKLEELKDSYETIPVLTYEEIRTSAELLFRLCNYIVEEAMNKNLILEMYNNAFENANKTTDSSTLSGYTMKNIQNVKIEMSNTILNNYVKEGANSMNPSLNRLLKPAFEYIYSHKSEKISLKDMATLCHVSQSYFSRVFLKETGENFSNYLSRLKIEWAKQLLEETDIPIAQISDELGFNESGYFIKTFKKQEGVTPFLYRKYCKTN